MLAGHEQAIRQGDKPVAFKALWGRHLTNLRCDWHGLPDSEGGPPAELLA